MRPSDITGNVPVARFRLYSGDDDGSARYVGKRQHNGDWPYRLIIEAMDMREHQTAAELKMNGADNWWVGVYAASLRAAGPAHVKRALECFGLDDTAPTPADVRSGKWALAKLMALADYGVAAVLWRDEGNNRAALMHEARRQASMIAGIMFGFAMDRPENAMGSTGWDMIAGNL